MMKEAIRALETGALAEVGLLAFVLAFALAVAYALTLAKQQRAHLGRLPLQDDEPAPSTSPGAEA
jgi:hypothetical protein